MASMASMALFLSPSEETKQTVFSVTQSQLEIVLIVSAKPIPFVD